ncbi:kinase suppressor of Ras 2 isoform X2 [Nylanderia fulva]|uniref:kinase suppressor of Ras 2 isoform X2 n=1 Tax=Nylanderia fulva TaxID=613905 RepID=UPI0010FB080E|nr:kinase suppressor of Ras 2 isoform X2 [Nylanderia fulva]
MADGEKDIRRFLDDNQSMIDVYVERLEGLRTQCSTSAELTQQEIRTLEGKLIKLYSGQLVNKAKLADLAEMRQYPSLQQWLRVVGLTHESIQMVCNKASSLEALKEKSERELSSMLGENNVRREEEHRRLCRALHNLRRYMDVLIRGEKENNDMKLYWDSWDRHHLRTGASPRPIRSRTTRSSVPSEESFQYNNNNNLNSATLAQTSSVISLTSTSPPSTPLLQRQKYGHKFPTTPPPCKKHQIGIQSSTSQPEVFPLTKSKSHESQLANRLENIQLDNDDTSSSSGNDSSVGKKSDSTIKRRNRLSTEPSSCCSTTDFVKAESFLPNSNSPIKSPPYTNAESDDNSFKGTVSSLQVPKSPRTPTVTRTMGHIITHRFAKTLNSAPRCDYCEKSMGWTFYMLKCRECKYKCHKECESKVPPSCGLPQELFNEFKRTVQDGMNVSPILSKPGITSPNHHSSNLLKKDRRRSHVYPSTNADSNSSNTSSCNSSTPSSPALLPANISQTSQAPVKQQFHFPGVIHETHRFEGTTMSSDSDRTVSVSGSGSVSTDSERTPVRVDSQDSQVSDSEIPGDINRWPRQNSLSMREWDIPYDELKIGEAIGTGRFGTVYRGNWYGDVAIKVINMDYYLDDDKILEAFKLEVGTFRKTRHENLVLFMGACMKPPRLAIVTSMSKGMTLYTHIHLRKDKFNMNKTTIIAQQISQGMGYLHARGIVHKDLKSKNIFLENGKVVITDFGLFSVTKLCYGNRKGNGLNIPPGWLCYLAPEIVRRLRPQRNRDQEELPFTAASDVYAFGTVWYELLCGEWPFKGQPPEAIIWQVGKGMKQPLANLQASRDVKDILMHCWSYHAEKRPDFAKLLTTLEKLPRKRLARSPSHPIHLSRSAESVF